MVAPNIKVLVAEENGSELVEPTERRLSAVDEFFNNSSNGFIADNTQAAIEELDTSIHAGWRRVQSGQTIRIKANREMRTKSMYNEGTIINLGYFVID